MRSSNNAGRQSRMPSLRAFLTTLARLERRVLGNMRSLRRQRVSRERFKPVRNRGYFLDAGSMQSMARSSSVKTATSRTTRSLTAWKDLSRSGPIQRSDIMFVWELVASATGLWSGLEATWPKIQELTTMFCWPLARSPWQDSTFKEVGFGAVARLARSQNLMMPSAQ